MIYRVLLATSILAFVGGCERKPEGQTVAVVNGDEITAAEVNAELRSANLPTSLDTSDARKSVLDALVDRKLLVQQAQADGIDKSPEYLNQQRRMSDNLLINMLISRQLNTMPVPSAADIRQFQESHPQLFAQREIWTLEQVQYATPKDAVVLAKVRNSNSLDELTQALSAAGIQLNRRRREVDTSIFPSDLFARISALNEGEPFIVPAGDQSVASVIVQRQPAPRTGEEARTVALNGMREAHAERVRQERAKALRAAAKIEYQSGYEPAQK